MRRAGLLVAPRTGLTRVIADWTPLIAVLVLYQLTRGLADELGRPIYVRFPIDVEQTLFGETLSGALQRHLLDSAHVRVWEVVPSLIYASHFLAPLAVGAYLYTRGRDRWLEYRSLLTLTLGLALFGYVLCPLAPPWMAAQLGVIEPTMRTAARGWSALGFPFAGDVHELGSRSTNPVAAMPSLHAALPVLYLVFFWARTRLLGRTVLVLYPLAMGFTLILCGEHYLVDVLAGWLTVVVAALVLLAIRRLGTRRAERREAPSLSTGRLVR